MKRKSISPDGISALNPKSLKRNNLVVVRILLRLRIKMRINYVFAADDEIRVAVSVLDKDKKASPS